MSDLTSSGLLGQSGNKDTLKPKLINFYVRQHPFLQISLHNFATSQRRAFERDVYDYSRAQGCSKYEAKGQVLKARTFCGEVEYDSDRSALEDELDDSEDIAQRLLNQSACLYRNIAGSDENTENQHRSKEMRRQPGGSEVVRADRILHVADMVKGKHTRPLSAETPGKSELNSHTPGTSKKRLKRKHGKDVIRLLGSVEDENSTGTTDYKETRSRKRRKQASDSDVQQSENLGKQGSIQYLDPVLDVQSPNKLHPKLSDEEKVASKERKRTKRLIDKERKHSKHGSAEAGRLLKASSRTGGLEDEVTASNSLNNLVANTIAKVAEGSMNKHEHEKRSKGKVPQKSDLKTRGYPLPSENDNIEKISWSEIDDEKHKGNHQKLKRHDQTVDIVHRFHPKIGKEKNPKKKRKSHINRADAKETQGIAEQQAKNRESVGEERNVYDKPSIPHNEGESVQSARHLDENKSLERIFAKEKNKRRKKKLREKGRLSDTNIPNKNSSSTKKSPEHNENGREVEGQATERKEDQTDDNNNVAKEEQRTGLSGNLPETKQQGSTSPQKLGFQSPMIPYA